jgi:hypothetical protein
MPMKQQDVQMFRSEREAVQFYASPAVAWFLPAASGLTIGGFIAAVVSLVSWRFFSDAQPFNTFLITMFVVAIFVWCYLTWTTFGKIGLAPQKQVKVIRLKWYENEGRTLKLVDLETVDDDELEKICRMVVNGGSLAIRRLRVYLKTDDRVEAFRLELVDRGLAIFDERQEIKLTRTGGSVFRMIAHYPNGGGEDA